jgi:hypothetical protein
LEGRESKKETVVASKQSNGSPFDDTVQLSVTWLAIGGNDGTSGTGMLGWFSDKEEVYRG